MKRFLVFLYLLCILVLLSACAASDNIGGKYADIKSVDKNTYLAFSEANPILNTKLHTANLYYRYGSQPVLVAEQRQIEVRSGEILEFAVIKELLRGPKASSGLLFSLIPSDVEVVNAVPLQDNRLLAITFSEAFVRSNEQADPVAEQLRRELILQSICLSITDNTPYLGIQIFIRPDDVGQSTYRLDNTFLLQGNQLPMMPLVREDTFVSNPQNIAKILLTAWSKKDYDTMVPFLSGSPNVNVLSELVEKKNNIITFDLGSGALYDDGAKATIATTLEPINRQEYLVFPLKLVNEEGIWKVDYDNFLALLGFM